jgi:hypothetical protein
MKLITVINQAGAAVAFKADTFDNDENGYLILRADGAVVAKFSPACWGGVYDQEATA